MRGNSHVQFLMGKAGETPLTYITNRKKYKSCYDDVLESLQGCRRFKEKMYKNWMNDVQDGSESCTSLEEYKKIAIFESGHRYFFIYSV